MEISFYMLQSYAYDGGGPLCVVPELEIWEVCPLYREAGISRNYAITVRENDMHDSNTPEEGSR